MSTPEPAERASDPHRVRRPQWTCRVDGAAWPCTPARQALAQQAGAESNRLGVLMSVLMAQAAEELGIADPTRLYRRFVAWTLPCDRACRVCGRAGHDVLPGVPLRLIPCEVAERLGRP